VVDGDPFAAAQAIMDEEDIQEILIATFPTGESRWMDEDVVDRLRKITGLGISRIVVRPEEALRPLGLRGSGRVAIVADDAYGSSGLTEAVGALADIGGLSVVMMAPLNLQVPGWTDQAGERRDEITARMQRTIANVGTMGVHADGEVIDGSAADAVKIAIDEYGAGRILLIATRRGPLDGEGVLDAASAAAGDVPVERVVVDAEAPTAPAGS
jgi:hypothetical protein